MKYFKKIIYTLTLFGIVVFIFLKWGELSALLHLDYPTITLLLLFGFVPIIINGVYFFLAINLYPIQIGFYESMGLTVLNTMYAYLLPIQTGMAVRAYYLKNKYAFPYQTYLSFLAGNYIVNSFVSLLLANFLCFYFWKIDVLDGLYFYTVSAITPLAFITLLLLDRIKIPDQKIKNKLFQFIKNTTSSIRKFKTNKRLLLYTVVAQLVLLLINGLRLYITFVLLGFEVDLVRVIAVQVFLNFSLIVSITPGNLGIKEGIIAFFAPFLSVDPSQALLVAIVDRAALMIIIFITGFISSRVFLNELENRPTQ